MGIIWLVWPQISKTMRAIETVLVTAPERAAAPTIAYTPSSSIIVVKFVKDYI